MNSKFSVNDSVWVAAAVMSYEKYHKDSLRNITDFTLLSTDIRERGTQINGATIEAARTSQWCCGDHEHHNYPYLKVIDSNKRRLAYPDEFGGGEIPEKINTDAIIDTSMGNVTVQQLIDFVKNDYKAIFPKEDAPSHLKEMVEKILDEYAVERNHAYENNQLGNYIRNDATNIIREAAGLSKDQYVIKGSVGQGQWAMVPWLGIFNKKITESAAKGVYIVYLLNKDGDTLYLTFNQGCTEIRNNNCKTGTIRIMHENIAMLRDRLDDRGFAADGAMKLGEGLTELAELYQEGVIFYKGYKKGQVSSEVELKNDLLDMIAIYNQYIDEVVDGVFYPTLDEFEPGISAEEYERVLCDESYVKKPWLDVLIYLYRMGGIGSCKQIANRFGKSASHYNSNAINIAKAVVMATGCPLDTRETGETRYWPVLFFGKDLRTNSPAGRFLYKMREPLKEAIKVIEERGEFREMKESAEFDKNLILYGPPGTGKTYNSAIYAVAICDDKPLEDVEALDYDVVMTRYNELKATGRIAFTTFHQSYGYEEFIEGIKPVMNDNQTSGDIKYTIEDGVFKKFCKNTTITFDDAWSKLVEAARANGNKYIFTRRTGSEINAQLINGELFSVQFEGETASHSDMPKSKIKQIYEQHDYEDRLDLPNGGARWVFDACYAVLDTLVKEYCLPEDPNAALENRVFIIDEINRGNISKIFGELITLIEGSKRSGMPEAASAILPYSGEEFSVPSNVYILGTMNTADRSIALMDTALRRRFQFIEKMPNPEVLKNITIEGLNITKMLESINRRIEFLYDREHTIGHAFFIPLKNNPSVECLGSIFEKSVIPLLQEYFYEDYQKIQLVLGDNGKKDEEADIKFIKDTKVVAKEIFVGNVEDVIDLPEKSYSINTRAFLKIESYKKIVPEL